MKNEKQKLKRVDKMPVSQNRHIITRGDRNNVVFLITENDEFLLFFNCLCNHFFSHNYFGLTPQMQSNSKIFGRGNGNKSFFKICPHIVIEDPSLCRIFILPSVNGYVELYKIEVFNRGKGTGSILMNALNEVSKQTGIKIHLKLGDPSTEKKFYSKQDEKMRRNFYHKNGFRRSPYSEYWTN